MNSTELENTANSIKIVGILHFAGNLISGGLLGTILVIGYLLINNNLDSETKKTCYNIINFNISFWIYFIISGFLMLVIIGFILLPIVGIIWIVALVIGFIKHLSSENYEYPMTIKLLK